MKDNWTNLLRILAFICVCSTIAYFIGYVKGRQKPFAPNVQKIIDGERKRLAERAEDFVEFHRGRAYQSGYEDGLMAASTSKEEAEKAYSNFLWKKHLWLIQERIRLREMSENEFQAEIEEARELLLRYTREDD